MNGSLFGEHYQAQLRAEAGMTRAANKAERVQDGWNARALDAVRTFAESHPFFLVEDVRKTCHEPAQADGRAWGAIITEAKRRGWISHGGFAAASSSNNSPKVLWRSNIYDAKAAS